MRSRTFCSCSVKEITELIPTYVQGWFLLQDAGLGLLTRSNLILTALKDDFSVERVAQELQESMA